MLYVIVVLLAVILLLSLHLWSAKKENKESDELYNFWYDKWILEIDSHIETDDELRNVKQKHAEALKHYAALEQGRDEESEAYEMQFLSFREEIHSLQSSRASYIDDLRTVNAMAVRCHETCLPSIVKDTEEIELITRLAEELGG